MKNISKTLWVILSAATGALFLYSAYAKAFPIHSFEMLLETYLSILWKPAAIFARFLIGVEAAIGILLLLNIVGRRKWVLWSAFTLLLCFSVFLVYLRIDFGNHVNCGCFGDAIWMSPIAALVKNVILLLIVGLLIRFYDGVQFRNSRAATLLLFCAALLLPYIGLPLGYKLDTAAMYTPGNTDTPSVNLRTGKHIIAFVHPFCGYCRKASLSMHKIHQQDATLPLFIFVGGASSDLTEFWQVTQAQDVPHSRMDAAAFLKYTGGSYPMILWVDNGKVITESGYNDLKIEDIRKWVK